jgi:hypothetical protein
MGRRSMRVLAAAVVVILGVSVGTASADICISVDEARDTFSDANRKAAVLLLASQFEAEGQRVVSRDCTDSYVVSHVELGRTITVTLAGPQGKRDGVAMGIDDVPALYSQLVRALLSGRDVGSMTKVVDRTNVVVAQTSPLRVQSDSLMYVRLGYGSQFGPGSHSGAAMGIGFRQELDDLAIDVSFANIQQQASSADYFGDNGSSGSWIKLEALRYVNKKSNSSAYWGGGVSWGSSNGSSDSKYWSGDGVQGELTAGYEMLRASNIRVFWQTDVVLPLYSVTVETFRYPSRSTSNRQYMPTATVSFGLGWQRDRRGHR